ncbi:MAG: hypothetical protein GEV07_24260 [Streptosporangiales bacterium]|nr:hypothetical protein [Streptosporangiales bacterium]
MPRCPRLAAEIARYDLPASLVVFLVAVPLSLGIAVATGAPVAAGLVAAIVGGLVVGAAGGSRLQVSGPAAGLTVVVADLITQFGWPVTCAITALAGLLQIVLGSCRVARVALALSPAIVHGMLAGIGVTIALAQLHVVLGGAPQSDALRNVLALPGQLAHLHENAAVLGLLVIAVVLGWPRLPKRLRAVPGPLAAIALATAAAALAPMDVATVEMPGSLLAALHPPQLPDAGWGAFTVGVVTVTAIASVESLLSATAVDRLRPGHRTDLDRELVGQGAANAVSGTLGGLPITGVIVRSSTNVGAGARTRASTVLHGVWVLVFALLLAGLVERIPMAALAGLLVVVGLQLVKVTDIRRIRRHRELPVYLATALGVVVFNLLEGVLIGLAVALVVVVARVVWARVDAEQLETPPADPPHWLVVVEGTLSFLALPRLSRVLGQIPAGSVVELELVTDFLDHAAHEHLDSWITQHECGGGIVHVYEVGGMSLRDSGPRPWRRAHHPVRTAPVDAPNRGTCRH